MDIIRDFFNDFALSATDTHLSLSNALIRLLLSLLLGMLIGYERKRKGQFAGIRTFALMSMGACLAMLLSIYVPQEYVGLKNGDPGRIAAQVVTGVGFIGGGAIIRMKGSIKGLTTAAGIWIAAIIGMTVGVGMYFSSIIVTLLCVGILVVFERLATRHHIGHENKVLEAKISEIVTDLAPYRKLFSSFGLHLSTYYLTYDYEASTTSINFMLLSPTGTDMLAVMNDLRRLAPITTLTLSSQIDI